MPPDFEARAETLFGAWLDARPPASEDTIVVGPDDRWIASSAWQKSIRRGEANLAARLVRGLWRLDPKYVRRRLPIILLEDVGWGDSDLMLVGMLAAGRMRWWPDREEGEQAAAMLTERAAAAVKDRSSVDLVAAVDRMFVIDPAVAAIFETADPVMRRSMAADRARTPFERMAALWSLGGTSRYPGAHVAALRSVSVSDFEAVVESIAETESKAAAAWRIGRTRMRNAMPLAALVTGEYAREESWIEDEREAIPPDQMVGAFPASALDQHTRPGIAAIARFVETCRPWHEWLTRWTVRKRVQRELTARFLFRVESGLLDRRLYVPWTREISKAPLEAACAMHGVPEGEIAAAKALLVEHLGELNMARRLITAATRDVAGQRPHRQAGACEGRHRHFRR